MTIMPIIIASLWFSTVLPRIGPSTKQSTELLKVSQSLPMVKQEKTEKEVGMSMIVIHTHAASRV